MLMFLLSPSIAFDAKVNAELERIASDPENDVYALADKAGDFFFAKVREGCARGLQTTQDQCELSRVLQLLDGSGVLSGRCASRDSHREKVACAISGAGSLRMVAALKGDPGKDIEWEIRCFHIFGCGMSSGMRHGCIAGPLNLWRRLPCQATSRAVGLSFDRWFVLR